MGQLPVVFAIARGKKAVVGTVADLVQSGGDSLGESLLVADFIYQIARGQDNAVPSHDSELEYGSYNNEAKTVSPDFQLRLSS